MSWYPLQIRLGFRHSSSLPLRLDARFLDFLMPQPRRQRLLGRQPRKNLEDLHVVDLSLQKMKSSRLSAFFKQSARDSCVLDSFHFVSLRVRRPLTVCSVLTSGLDRAGVRTETPSISLLARQPRRASLAARYCDPSGRPDTLPPLPLPRPRSLRAVYKRLPLPYELGGLARTENVRFDPSGLCARPSLRTSLSPFLKTLTGKLSADPFT